jgi:hypothetical protein
MSDLDDLAKAANQNRGLVSTSNIARATRVQQVPMEAADDLDQLAVAARQGGGVNVYVGRSAPAQRQKQYSPFSWGLGIGLGLFVAAVLIAIVSGIFNAAVSTGGASHATPVVVPDEPIFHDHWIRPHVDPAGNWVEGHYERVAQ